jgi:hypothetical protein
MKHILSLLAALAVAFSMTSCTSSQKLDLDDAQLASYANIALTAAELGGVVNSKQAAVARAGGKLLLDFKAAPDNEKLVLLSNVAVDYAVSEGKLTPEQAQALRDAGTVPLVPPAGPSNPLLPDITPLK